MRDIAMHFTLSAKRFSTQKTGVQDVFWTSYVRSVYVLCLRGCAVMKTWIQNKKNKQLQKIKQLGPKENSLIQCLWNWKVYYVFELRMRQVSFISFLSLAVFRTSTDKFCFLSEEGLARQKCWIIVKQHSILLLNSCLGSKSLLHLLKTHGGY